MPYFDKTPTASMTPIGRRQWLRSTEGLLVESYTVYAPSVPDQTIDGEVRKILQCGQVMAKITSGAGAGKIGPFQAGATDGRQTLTNIVGINETYEPWRLLPTPGAPQDVEVGVAYHGVGNQSWCTELDAAGLEIVLTNATADALRGVKGVDILFH